MLDSSPLPAAMTATAGGYQPQPRRPLKRSASTASLPTPPHSVDKRQNTRQDSDIESSSDDDSDNEDYGRVLSLHGGEQQQGGASADKEKSKARLKSVSQKLFAFANEQQQSQSQESLELVSSARSTTTTATLQSSAPASPPPSRSAETRAKQQRITLRSSKPRPTKTIPVRKAGPPKVDAGPIRDTDNNLFLSSSPVAHQPPPRVQRDPAEYEEKPTMAYVFRGVKTHFANPLYGVDPSAYEASLLPVDHPDFSPAPTLRPRILFPPPATAGGKRYLGLSDEEGGGDSADDEDVSKDIRPQRLFEPEKAKTESTTVPTTT